MATVNLLSTDPYAIPGPVILSRGPNGYCLVSNNLSTSGFSWLNRLSSAETLENKSFGAIALLNTTEPSNVSGQSWIYSKSGEVYAKNEAGSEFLVSGGNLASTDINTFVKLDTIVADKSLVNLEDGGTFTSDISVPDEVYGVTWDASVEVPTKNAVYDKIESLSFLSSTDIDTFTELDTIVADKSLVNLDDGGTFTNPVSVPDDPYALDWNASVEVPTKNAIYDAVRAVVPTPDFETDVTTGHTTITLGDVEHTLTADLVLPEYATLRGINRLKTILKTNGFTIISDTKQYVSIENMTIDGETNFPDMIYVNSAGGCVIKNVVLQGGNMQDVGSQQGFLIENCYNVYIINTGINNINNSALSPLGFMNIQTCTNVTLYNVFYLQCFKMTIDATNIYMSNCVLDTLSFGINLSGNLVVNNCSFTNCDDVVMTVGKFSSCNFIDTQITTFTDLNMSTCKILNRGIASSSVGSKLILSGVEVDSSTVNGVYLTDPADGGIVITGCNIHDCTNSGVRVDGGEQHVISGNVIKGNGGDGVTFDISVLNSVITSNTLFGNSSPFVAGGAGNITANNAS